MTEPRYRHPLTERYASREMESVFAPGHRFGLWRRLWIALAEAQQELGLDIPDEALDEMRAARDTVNLERAAEYERRFRHDVMAHVHLFGDDAPSARGLIHLGATSAFVGDNTDILQHREALGIVRDRLVLCVESLAAFAERTRGIATLAYTHFQPAQPTTVGKRASLWLQDLVLDIEEIEHRIDSLHPRGAKGTTGTQASFLQLFGGDHGLVEELDRRVCEKIGFGAPFPVTGQTVTRKLDAQVLAALSGVAQSASKIAHDLRLLAHLQEVEEPAEAEQVGSSAMPHKRNPMRSERICALARHAIVLAQDPAFTAATQWFERTLDDSANRRLAVPDAFMTVDAILVLLDNVAEGLVLNEPVIRRNLERELPFLAAEAILMAATAAGGDRQHLHEALRGHAWASADRIKSGAEDNDFLERIMGDPTFALDRDDVASLMDPARFVGRAPEQVDAFLSLVVRPLLGLHRDRVRAADLEGEVRV